MIVFTRTPCRAFSIASEWPSALIPAFEILYAVSWIDAATAAIEEMFTIEPDPCSRITGTTAWQDSRQPLRFTSMIRSNPSSVSFSGALSPVPMPTLFWRKSILPQVSTHVGGHRLAVAGVRPVGGHAFGAAALVGDHLRRLPRPIQIAVGEQQLRSLARERDRRGPPRSDRLAGRLPRPDDDSDLSLEPHRAACSSPGRRPIVSRGPPFEQRLVLDLHPGRLEKPADHVVVARRAGSTRWPPAARIGR